MNKLSKSLNQYPRYFLLSAVASSLLLSACGGSDKVNKVDEVVSIADTTSPIIKLAGESAVNVPVNGSYTDAGAAASDNIDGTISVVTKGSVDTSVAGTYTLTYTATDKAGNVSTSTRNVVVFTPTLKGTAAAGAAIVGTVTVKDALGQSKSELIEADGSYSVDVSGLTPPFRLRAEGNVGGKTYKLHSYAQEATADGTVNITPFTDLIIANAAQKIAANFFDEESLTELSPADVEAQEDALQVKLQSVFDALGLDSAINLLNTTFSADHSGLDAALDIIKIETDSTTNIATIQNILDGTSIIDDVTNSNDNQEVIVVEKDTVTMAVTDTQAIAALFSSFSTRFSDGLPTAASLNSLFAKTFLHEDQGQNEFLTDITTDPSIIGIDFTSVSVRDLDSNGGTATVDFNVTFNGITDAESETWQLEKDSELGWQFLGNQQFFEADLLSFHCNDYDGTDDMVGGCGLNVSFEDNDFSNNGTDGEPLASATMTIIDGNDGITVKDIVYLGTSQYGGAGELSVYNQTNQQYTWDYVGFGDAEGDVDPSIFEIGDIIRYSLYTEELDLTVPSQPEVSEGDEIISFDRILTQIPETVGRFPALTQEGLAALNNFSLGDDLILSWTLQPGTVIEYIWLDISDNQGNYYDVDNENIDPSKTSLTLDSEVFAEALLDASDFNEETLSLTIRIYSRVTATGQTHSTDYRTSVDNGSDVVTGGDDGTSVDSDGSITCNTESPWDDFNDKPTVFYSINDFETAVADCESKSTLPSLSKADLADVTWYVDDERIAFDSTGDNLIITTYGDDGVLGGNDDETFYGTVADYASNVIEFSYSETDGGTVIGRDLIRIKKMPTFEGKSLYLAVALWEYYEWDESDGVKTDKAHQGGELHTAGYALDADFDWDAWDAQFD